MEGNNSTDNSTALPGKRDAKSIKSNEWLFKQLLLKVCCRKPKPQSFARMRPSCYVLVNFVNRCSCLCTQQGNMALKIKILQKYNKDISVDPDIFIKNQIEGDSDDLFQHRCR